METIFWIDVNGWTCRLRLKFQNKPNRSTCSTFYVNANDSSLFFCVFQCAVVGCVCVYVSCFMEELQSQDLSVFESVSIFDNSAHKYNHIYHIPSMTDYE